MELTSSDYNKIIDFYNTDIPNNKSKKDIAEDILSSKLCKCIKILNPLQPFNSNNNY